MNRKSKSPNFNRRDALKGALASATLGGALVGSALIAQSDPVVDLYAKWRSVVDHIENADDLDDEDPVWDEHSDLGVQISQARAKTAEGVKAQLRYAWESGLFDSSSAPEEAALLENAVASLDALAA